MNFELFYFDYALVFIGFKDFLNYSELKTVLATVQILVSCTIRKSKKNIF